MVLLTLAHHIDLRWMEEAYRRTRKDGAVGVDGVTAEAYERRLHENLSDRLERFKSGRYRTPPADACTFPRMGRRTQPGPSAFPPWRTKCSGGRCSWCWSRCTSRTFWTAPNAVLDQRVRDGVIRNARALSRLRSEVRQRWHKWLNRRSHAKRLAWPTFNRLLKRHPLPPARVVHSIYAA